MTSDFVKANSRTAKSPFSMIEQKGLAARLREELALAAGEIARDPRGFIRDLFGDDSRDGKRRRRIYIGLSCAVAAHLALFIVILIVGWPQMLTPSEQEQAYKVELLKLASQTATQQEPDKPEPTRGDNGGGGGGGDNSPIPESRGAPPQALPTPSPVDLMPKLQQPASLPITPNIEGPESPPPPPDVPLGNPNATNEIPSPGPGKGGGIGTGEGKGVGSGTDPGAGPGKRGGSSNEEGAAGPLHGVRAPIPEINYNAPKPQGYSKFDWIYRARAIVTPEAQANKVAGTVFFRITIKADGTITDIEVVNSVPFMTESAIEALKRCKFRPATIDGKPVTVRRVPISIEVRYDSK